MPSQLPAAVALAGLFVVAAPALAAPPPPAIDDAIAEAAGADKALVLEFYADWCGPCKQFAATVLPRPEVVSALTGVAFVKYDGERGPGKVAAARYGVNAYPTFVVVDAGGDAVAVKRGTMSAPEFVAFLAQADLAVLDEAGVRARVARAPNDPQTLISAARWHRNKGNAADAHALYRRASAVDRGNRAAVASAATWESMELARYRRIRDRVVDDFARFVRSYPSSPHARTAFELVAASGQRSAAAIDGMARLLLHTTKDDELNSAVYRFLAAGAVEPAVEAARRQVALDPRAANPHDTLAEALHYAGNKSEAIAVSKTGLALASDQQKPAFSANLARFSKPTFEPGYDVEIARWRAAERLRRLPGVDPLAQRQEPPPARPKSAAPANPLRDYHAAVRRLFNAAGQSCQRHRGALPEAYVRIEPAASGRHAVVVLEPGASRALRKCLVRALAPATLPPAPAGVSRVTMPIRW